MIRIVNGQDVMILSHCSVHDVTSLPSNIESLQKFKGKEPGDAPTLDCNDI